MFGINKSESWSPSEGSSTVIVRNCSKQGVLDSIQVKFGKFRSVSGRYFVLPEDVEFKAFKSWANDNGYFVKESNLGGIMVADLMIDREKIGSEMRGRIHPRRNRGYHD